MRIWIYARAIAAAAVAGLTAAITALNDGVINGGEWIAIIITIVVALGAVYAVAGGGVQRTMKVVTAAIVAGLGAVATAWTTHHGFDFTGNEWISIALAVLLALGVVGATPPHPVISVPAPTVPPTSPNRTV
jgi:hypothetical protein